MALNHQGWVFICNTHRDRGITKGSLELSWVYRHNAVV